MTKPIVTLTKRPLNNFDSVKVSEEMGDRANHPIDGKPSPHNGIDLVPSGDLKVFATHNGSVVKSTYQVGGNGKGWGNYITIQSDDKSFYTRYAHFAQRALFKEGQHVIAGQQIGTAGKTGGATGVHLHFEILDSARKHINPRQSLAAAFPEFISIVEASGLQGDLYGDQNDNTLIGNTKSNYMHGLAGSDTYYFPSLSGSDVIDDVDGNGRIAIGNGYQSVLIAGNANSRFDSKTGEVIPDEWTLNGFNLKKVAGENDQSDLVIYKLGTSFSEDSAKVVVKNYPLNSLLNAQSIVSSQYTNNKKHNFNKMTIKIFKRICAMIAVILAFSSSNLAFAQQTTQNSNLSQKIEDDSKVNTKIAEDKKIKRAIEELRKKYPISLLDEKKKNYKTGQKINIDDYSEAEIKAAFLNADQNFVSRKKIARRSFEIDGAGISVDEEVSVKNQQEVILIGKSCYKLRHSNWAKLNKKWNNLFDFIFSDDLPISYYTIKYVPYEEAGFCLDMVEEVRGL